MGLQKARTIEFWISGRESYTLHLAGSCKILCPVYGIRGKIVTFQEIGSLLISGRAVNVIRVACFAHADP